MPSPTPGHLFPCLTEYPELLHLSPYVFKPCPALCCPPDCLGFLMNKLSPIYLFLCTFPVPHLLVNVWPDCVSGTAVFLEPCYHTRKTHLGDFVPLPWSHLLARGSILCWFVKLMSHTLQGFKKFTHNPSSSGSGSTETLPGCIN